ncbi:MAG TPA: SARP family transcriptional regulator, partial [Micromonosporaceae bacterium]|nr:SARP family transcriptional regulator [Micromonosporaceae bacterium]
MDFSVLGPVEVQQDGRALPMGSGRERFVLAMLLLNADRLTSASFLINALWTDPPRSAKAQLHNMISNLRRRLCGQQDGLIASRPLGYELRLGTHGLDLLEFRRLVAGGRQAAADGDQSLAVALYGEGLSLWRGPALSDVGDELAIGARQALHEERLVAAESKLDACLALGRFDELLSDLPTLVAEHPYRERLWQVQMLALAGDGRRAEALQTYRRAHRRFVEDLGVEPGPVLRELEQRILRGESAGPVRSTGPALPRQLPPATAAITGRDKLIGEIRAELLRSETLAGPIVVLVGPGGVGKTTLGLTVAHAVRKDFPDGQLYADLRGSREDPADPHVVAGRFLRALGVDGPSLPDDREERIAMYRSRLAASRTLVMLDDAASEDQARPLLPGDGGCAALITSRRRLAALMTNARWTIPVLDTSDAAELLTRIVGHRRVAAEPHAVTAIAELCGHLPLAVCVAAARLAVHPDWTLTDLQSMLAAERRRLDELAVGDLDVRASIALSYRSLSPDLRRLFRRLGLVSAPDWPTWVAGELNGAEPVDRLLDDLTDVHLIEPLGLDAVGQRRFRLHDLVADFAIERAIEEEPEHERDAALTRMLSGWLALASEADERAEHGMIPASGLPAPPPPRLAQMKTVRQTPREWLEAERVSLTTAVDQACRAGLAEIAGVLALRLSGFLVLRAHYDDWERTLHAATECVREHGPDEVLSRLLGALFAVSLWRSRSAELPKIAADELALARRLGDPQREVGALANAGWAARLRGRLGKG